MNKFYILFINIFIDIFIVLFVTFIVLTTKESIIKTIKNHYLPSIQEQKEIDKYKSLIGHKVGTCLITNIKYTQNKIFVVYKDNKKL